ncbi:MAG: acyltransferase [Bacteroidetes bacterium]|nr:acyltransferase [Bacteroidota bacterium]
MFILKFFYKLYSFVLYGKFIDWVIGTFPFFKPVKQTKNNESPIYFKQWLKYKILGKASGPYWPIHKNSTFRGSWKNVYVGIDAAPGISPGCYIQALGKIFIGDYAQIAPNVGLISANHFMLDIRKHVINEIRIGSYSRIGMGSLILPGVVLGDFTTVAAGSVVTKSFPKGYCVISGNPAEIVQDYSDNSSIISKFIRYKNEFEYNGYIPSTEFEEFRIKYLNI